MSRRVSIMASPMGKKNVSSPVTPKRLIQFSPEQKKPIKNKVSDSLNKRVSKREESPQVINDLATKLSLSKRKRRK